MNSKHLARQQQPDPVINTSIYKLKSERSMKTIYEQQAQFRAKEYLYSSTQ